jgi:hypothetical protein
MRRLTVFPTPPLVTSRPSLSPGGECAPLPPAAHALLDKGGLPLLPRLWERELGSRTPKDQAALRERVRRAAIQAVYEGELAVSEQRAVLSCA